MQFLRSCVPWVAAGVMLLFLLGWAFEPIGFYLQAHWYLDDSFFYYQVARNIVAGNGSTFDGINLTNGYQPLWQLVCACAALFFRTPLSYLHAINAMQAVCSAGVAYLIAKHLVVRSSLNPLILLPLGYFTLYQPFLANFSNGLETSLCLVLFCVVADELFHIRAGRLGVFCGLAFLSRTDSIFLLPPLGLYLLLGSFIHDRCRAKLLRDFLVGYLVCVLPYLALNVFYFHTVMPISGAVKQTWAQLTIVAEAPLQMSWVGRKLQLLLWPLDHPDYYPIGIVVIMNCLGLVASALRRQWVTAVLAAFSVTKYVGYVLFFHTYARFQWYYAPDYIVALYVCATLVSSLGMSNQAVKIRDLVTAAVSIAVGLYMQTVGWATHSPTSALVNWRHHRTLFQQKVPLGNELQIYHAAAMVINKMPLPRRLVLSGHNSGVLAFFSRYRVVNMDGLINGRTRLEYLRKYGWDFLHYLDSQEYIGGYIDCVAEGGAYSDYHRAFVEQRGYVEVDLRRLVNERKGHSMYNSLVMFLKPEIAKTLKNHKTFGRYLLAPDQRRA